MFHDLYVAYSRQVYSYLLGRTGSKDVAADLLHDVYLRIWNRMEALERIPEEQRIYWIFSIASNLVKDYYRKSSNRRQAEEQLRDRNKGAGAPAGDLSQLLAGRERYRELESAIGALPEELRCILLMKVVGGMNSSRIGEALGMPAGTARYKISQARALLAGRLGLPQTELAAAERSKSNG
ncbi:RNA polymerase sigma factor [Paenibacillus alkalitolerans]|uniref:RNA polymerase sigma factor n=1 Tax=Paenibacillus alkalitolerans TaxID=2799335 RepID=UPI0018F5B717|nr:RNA polymerase sigma factor [Paenibacillus alkalitolerans]